MKSQRRQFLKGIVAASASLGLPVAGRAAEPSARLNPPAARGKGRRAGRKVFATGAYFSDADDMPEDLFGDLGLMRKGTSAMTMGSGLTSIEPIESVAEWSAKAAALREIFRQTLGTPPLADCPLEVRIENEVDHGTILERRITYLLSPGERTASLLLLPKSANRAGPALLTIHPTGSDGKEQTVGRGEKVDGQLTPAASRRAYGLHLAQRGYVTFSPDLLGSGERIYPGRRAFDNQPLLDEHPHWSGTGKDLHDLRRALDVMQAQPEIDPARIGSIGHSQGAGLTCYLAAVDERVRVGVANCGVWPTRVRENPFHLARTAWWTGRPALRAHFLAGKPAPIDIHELLALAAPRPFLNIAALNDCGFSADDEPLTRPAWENLARNVKKIYALHGVAEKFENVLHLNGHDFHDPVRELAYAFLDRHLRSPG